MGIKGVVPGWKTTKAIIKAVEFQKRGFTSCAYIGYIKQKSLNSRGRNREVMCGSNS